MECDAATWAAWSAVGVSVLALGLSIITFFSNSRARRKELYTGIIMSRIDAYGKREMLIRIILLRKNKIEDFKLPKDVPDGRRTMLFAAEFNRLRELWKRGDLGPSEATRVEALDDARRHIKHYFLSIGYLVQRRIISPDMLREIHTSTAIETLLNVVWPIEDIAKDDWELELANGEKVTIQGRKYEHETFKKFKDIFVDDGPEDDRVVLDWSPSCFK